MQITCNKATANLLFALCGICFAAALQANTGPGFEQNGTQLVVGQDHRIVKADRKLAAMMKTGEVAPVALMHLPGSPLLLLLRKPTRALPMHRCGAGTEDYLLLLREGGGEAHVEDTLRLQSCEDGEHLNVDDPESTDDVIHALSIKGDQLSFEIVETFSDDKAISRRYRVTERFEELK